MSGIDNSLRNCRVFSLGDAYHALSAGYQALTVITVAIVTIFTLAAASYFVFKALVNAFTELNLVGDAPHERTARKVNGQAEGIKPPLPDQSQSEIPLKDIISISTTLKPEASAEDAFDAKDYISSLQRKAKANLAEGSKFLRTYLSEQLAKGNMKTLETKDDGDCFWDAVSQSISILDGKPVSLKDVRMACYDYLQFLDKGDEKDNWVKIAFDSGLDESYATFKENIQYTTDECFAKKIPAPVWGDKIAAKIVSRLYDVCIESYTVNMYEVDVEQVESQFFIEDEEEKKAESEYEIAVKQDRVFRTFTKKITNEETDYDLEEDEKGDPIYIPKAIYTTEDATFAEVVEIVDVNEPDITDEREVKSVTLRTLKVASYQSFPSGHVLLVVPSDF